MLRRGEFLAAMFATGLAAAGIDKRRSHGYGRRAYSSGRYGRRS